MVMSKHARFAPSAAHRWIACPASISLSEKVGGGSGKSEYASEGTALHEITAVCLKEKKDPSDFLGTTLTDEDNPDWSMECDQDHVNAVQFCVEEVKRITLEIGAKGGRIELSVSVNEDCWGQADVLIWSKDYAVVIDFKFGRGKSVKAENNSQLMLYYLGAMRFLYTETPPPLPSKAKLFIIQPRIPNPVREWETTFEEVKIWYQKFVSPAYDQAKKGESPCNPGQEQCQFCPANGICGSRADYLLGVAETEFKDYAVDVSGTKANCLPAPVEQTKDIKKIMSHGLEVLNTEIAGRILAYQDDFDNFFKRVGEFALQSALDGTAVPGFKIVYGKSNRKWKGTEQEVALLLKSLDVEPFEKKLISPAKAEKALGRKRKGEIEDNWEKPLGKKILVDESDTREEVDLTGESDMDQFATGSSPKPEYADGSAVFEGTDDIMSEANADVHVFEEPDVGEIDDIMDGFDDVVEEKETEQTPEVWPGLNPSPPSKRTKKFKLMTIGLKGGVSLKEVADKLFEGDVGQVKKGLRNLNERDGYTIVIHANNTFTVKE